MSEYFKIYTPALIGCTLLILLFITKPLYSDSFDKGVQIEDLTKKQIDKQSHLDDLKNMETYLASDRITKDPKMRLLKEQVARYVRALDPNEIMRTVLLNNYTSPDPTTGEYRLLVTNVTVGSGSKLPNGLSKTSVTVNTEVTNVNDLLQYITYLLSSKTVAFSIRNITLPIDTGETNTDTMKSYSIPLEFEVYYYE